MSLRHIFNIFNLDIKKIIEYMLFM